MDKLPYEELERMIDQAKMIVPPGSRWRHYKGTEYIISDIAIIEATNEVAVIYTSVDHSTVSFIRALNVWREAVEWDCQSVSRFTKVL